MKKILVIEDEVSILEYLKDILEDSGYDVDVANNGLEGFSLFQKGQYELILLDILMPKIDGYVVLEMIRRESNIPVIILTAMGQENNQVKGFDLKADDYIVKPFSPILLLKRIEVALRRADKPDAEANRSDKILSYKKLAMNTDSCEVYVSGNKIVLTYMEYKLLKMFLENKNRVITREQILNNVWGYDYLGNERVVIVHISNLRKKLGVDYIETSRGTGGYLIRD